MRGRRVVIASLWEDDGHARNDLDPQFGVRCPHTMEANQMRPRMLHQCSQALHKLHGPDHDAGGTVGFSRIEISGNPGAVQREAVRASCFLYLGGSPSPGSGLAEDRLGLHCTLLLD